MDSSKVLKKYRTLYTKRHASRKAAARVFCLDCCAYLEEEVNKCTNFGCPLFKRGRSG